MRRFTLLFLSLSFFTFSMTAQNSQALEDWKKVSRLHSNVQYTGFETIDVPVAAENPFLNSRTEVETIVGTTIYDLQTNNSTRSMIARHDDGSMAATFTFGEDSGNGYPDRGAGYNFNDGSGFGAQPTARVESERTGWSNIVMLEDGSQFMVAHTVNNEFITNRNASGTWVEDKIPTNIPGGVLWPRAASDGNTVHVIGISAPAALDGAIYEGLDGHLVYYRSTDGGATWDLIDQILPGLDQTKYNAMSADSYMVDARDGTVAVAHFGAWGDTQVAISSDGGTTWETEVVFDFPLDLYVTDSGVDPTMLEPADTFDAAGDIAVFTSDNTGDVLVDNSGLVHVWFGQYAVSDVDLTDGLWNVYPGQSGINYWNQTHGPDSTRLIADLVDGDGDGVFNLVNGIDGFGNYGTSMTSTPTAAVDAEGRIVLAYSAVTDNFINQAAMPEPQQNRHIFVTASSDGGATWLDLPVDMIRMDIVLEPDLQPAIEAAYPFIAKNMGGERADMVYQADFEPGTAIGPDADNANTNFINYIGITFDEVGLIEDNVEVVDAEAFNFTIAPNPAHDFVQINYEIPAASQVILNLSNMMGQHIRHIEAANHNAGQFNTNISVNDLPKGVYLLQLRADEKVAVQKLIVE